MFIHQPIEYFFVFVLVAFAGLVDSIAGGGGLITVPTYLSIGLPPQVLLGTNKLVSTVGTSLSVFRYFKAAAIEWKTFRVPALLSFLFSILGAWLSRFHSRDSMLWVLLMVAPVILVLSLKPKFLRISGFSKFDLFQVAVSSAILIGCYDGFFGPGTGSFFLFSLLYLGKLSAKSASANARLLNYSSNLGAVFYFATEIHFALDIAIIGIGASLIGNYIGSHFVIKHAEKVVRPIYFLVLVSLILKLIWDYYGNPN